MSKKEISKVGINNIISVDGYNSGENGNLYVSMVQDLTLVKGFNPKKETGVRTMIVTANVSNPEFVTKYGNKIIIVSKEFTKLSKKQKLALLSIENDMVRAKSDISAKYTSNLDEAQISGTHLDKKIMSELNAVEQYGFRTVKRALNKKNNLTLKTERTVGGYMHKQFKKVAKDAKKSGAPKSNPDISLEMPVTLSQA